MDDTRPRTSREPRTFQHNNNHFSGAFKAQYSSNFVCTNCWSPLEDTLFATSKTTQSMTLLCIWSNLDRRKRALSKAATGRGPRRSEWVQCLLQSFEVYKWVGVKFSFALFLKLSQSILLGLDSLHIVQSRDPRDGRLLTNKLTSSWI